MSDETRPPFDPSTLDADNVEMPEPKPDHTASGDTETPTSEPPPRDNVRPFARPSRKGDRTREKRSLPPKRAGALVRPLTDLYTSVGVVVMGFDPACGTAVVENAEDCAKALDALAMRNDSVRRALYAITETGAWGAVIAAHMPLLLMVLVHHGPRDVSAKMAPFAYMTAPNAMNMMGGFKNDDTVPPNAEGA